VSEQDKSIQLFKNKATDTAKQVELLAQQLEDATKTDDS